MEVDSSISNSVIHKKTGIKVQVLLLTPPFTTRVEFCHHLPFGVALASVLKYGIGSVKFLGHDYILWEAFILQGQSNQAHVPVCGSL